MKAGLLPMKTSIKCCGAVVRSLPSARDEMNRNWQQQEEEEEEAGQKERKNKSRSRRRPLGKRQGGPSHTISSGTRSLNTSLKCIDLMQRTVFSSNAHHSSTQKDQSAALPACLVYIHKVYSPFFLDAE